MLKRTFILTFVVFLLFIPPVVSGNTPEEPRTWIFFTDKGYTDPASLKEALTREEAELSSALRERLSKVRSTGALLGERDLPVFREYLEEITALTGLKPHAVSRSLNAASFALDEAQRKRVLALPFVERVQPVRVFRSKTDPPAETTSCKRPYRSVQDSLFYGASFTQNALENFIEAHEEGYTGAGVLVGMLDAGWNNLEHVCFDQLDIVATWDFVNGDSSVADDPGQMGSGSHGTKTLSCLAGYDPGNLIGTAYDVSVALAKTENTEYERRIEEDNWIAGLEWLDSLGCVIVTSSVSYLEFDYPDPSYTWEDLDGNTALCTIAADDAVARGVVVLNSDGNNGGSIYPYNKMNVPADGDSVLMIGSVNGNGERASFSSYGPTYDGRIKPDLVALGVAVRVASSTSTTGYTAGSGSSFSTPITAGACALLLQADPSLTPMDVQAFLKETGDQAAAPDTLRGWGLYDVWEAIQNVLAPVQDARSGAAPRAFKLLAPYPNPFNRGVTIPLRLLLPGDVTIRIYSPDGRLLIEDTNWYESGVHRLYRDFGSLPSGVYFCSVTSGNEKSTIVLLHLK